MTLKKATVAAGVVAMSVGLFNSFNAEADSGSCTIILAGIPFACTKIWCHSTWEFSACGLGDVTSQECSSVSSC